MEELLNTIYGEMKHDEKYTLNHHNKSKDYNEGFSEAVRDLGVIIKQETGIDVNKNYLQSIKDLEAN